MPRPISLELSFSALRSNLETVINRLAASGTPPARRPKIWAVVKANAYGHGIEPAVAALQPADGLALLDLDEAIRAREAGWNKPILLLEGFFDASDLPLLDRYRLVPTLHCREQFDMLRAARLTSPLDAYLKLNTGMNRLGFMPAEFAQAWAWAELLQDAKVLRRLGKMTHFARADDDLQTTQEQCAAFFEVTQGMPGPVSLRNSAATLDYTGPCLDAGAHSGQLDEEWVRPGICLYGSSPFSDRSAHDFGLLPVQTLHARLLATRTLPPGTAIGYGHQFVTRQVTRTGIVACGYGDGYPRHAPSGTPITVDGVRTRVLGRISMDMLAVDLEPVPQAHAGSPVVLWGRGGPSVDEVAHAAATIGYELVCGVTARVPRRVHAFSA